jgi:hypothetical protein
MAKIVIFKSEVEAIRYSDKIHSYLQSNRPGYNAIKWCTPEKSADGLTWMVKQPLEEEVQKWVVPIDTVKELSVAVGITEPMPEIGVELKAGQFYLDKGEVLKCETAQVLTAESKELMTTFRSKTPIDVKPIEPVKEIESIKIN